MIKWQSFTAIGQWSSEILWRNKEKINITSKTHDIPELPFPVPGGLIIAVETLNVLTHQLVTFSMILD